ncbi:CidA/LrgA family protein [Roseivivax sp. CAU 1761]
MIRSLAILLTFQLAGETLSRGLGLPVPGPVLGLGGLFLLLVLRPRIADEMRASCQGLLAHLSLLFVPAGTGVVAHLGVFGSDGPALLAALVVSTVAAILVAVATFRLAARLIGTADE